MKKLLIVLLTLVCSTNVFAQGVVFEKGTFTEVMEKAKQQKKIVFIDFYTTWCGPCKVVAETVFPDPAFGECYNSKFINYQIDAEKGEGIDLAKKYNIKAYPSFLYIDADGVVISRLVGGKSIDEFIEQANNVNKFAKYGGVDKMISDYKNGVRDLDMLKDYYKYVSNDEKPSVLVKLLSAMTDEQLLDANNKYFDYEVAYDFPLFSRIANTIIKLNSNDEAYNFNIVFPAQRKLTEYLDVAIQQNDQTRIKEIIELKKKYQILFPDDEDINYIWGRGLFFCSLDLINISNDFKNSSQEVFKKNLEKYMTNLIAVSSIDSLQNYNAKLLKDFPGAEPLFYKSFYEQSEYFNTAAFQWVDYYWKISPSDKGTKERCANWVKFLSSLNNLNDKAAISAANLLVRVGYKKDAIKLLENSIVENKKYGDQLTAETIKNLEFALMVIKNNK